MTDEKEIADVNNQYKNNAVNETKLENQIIRQVEYYFGDVNLVRDKFLLEQVKLDDGWVPFEVLISFNRLAKLSTDSDVIAAALSMATSGLLEVSVDNKKVRRSPEMPVPEMNEERRKELQARTVYAKGFPKDSQLDDLLKFFKEKGDTENVILRRYIDKQSKKRMFKGSVFATFKTKEHAEKFIETKELKYGESELLLLRQEEYLQKKQEEYAEKKEKKDKKNKDKDAPNTKPENEIKLPTGTVFHFSEGHDTMTREDIKEALEALGAEISYIDFKVGDKSGWIRLSKENAAIVVAEKIIDGKIKIGDSEVVFNILQGDEEKAYLDKTVEEIMKRRKNQRHFSKQKQHKGNFRGKHQGRKRKQDQHGDAPPSKVNAYKLV